MGKNKFLLITTALLAVAYTSLLFFGFGVGNYPLFILMASAQMFFLWMVLSYVFTVWKVKWGKVYPALPSDHNVDVFITVAGEPIEIVAETLKAALDMEYKNFKVFILNDGLVAKKENWRDIEKLAETYNVTCITRTEPGGAKAGNINHAMKLTNSKFIAVFDADHVPHKDFLLKTMHYFDNKEMGFVQSPQFYKNNKESYVSWGAWKQQELFFGKICPGKETYDCTPMCGTNMVIRRTALEEIGGVVADNIAEDFVTGYLLHCKGWKSLYIPEVLSEGLAPVGFKGYYKQQLRWARGSIAVLFKYKPWNATLTWQQKISYIASASYFLYGIAIFMNMMIPIIFFFTGITPFTAGGYMMTCLLVMPYMLFLSYSMLISNGFEYSFRAQAFSISSWTIHLEAIVGHILATKAKFWITPKKRIKEKTFGLIIPHLLYIFLNFLGIAFFIVFHGITLTLITNVSWTILNIIFFFPFIRAGIKND